jgi:NADPH2:quinone reductase
MVKQFGDPSVLEPVEVATPAPERGQIALDVSMIGVNWLDTQIRAGRGLDVFAVQPPFVPGGAVAGTVTALGTDVADDWIGARVVAHAAAGRGSAAGYGGGYAEAVVADIDSAFRVPPGLDLAVAAALIDDGATALALLERTPVHPGDRVLIAPGLGGLGHLAIQLARSAGAFVIAAVRGPDKLDRAGRLADDVVDYAHPEWPGRVREITGGRGLDVVFDGIGGSTGAAAAALLADGGRFSGYGMSSGTQAVVADARHRRLTVVDMAQLPEFWPETPRRVATVLERAAAGRLSTIIGRTYPLAQAAVAHADIEARRFTGKILLAT